MPGSTISAFGDPDEYQTELQRDGNCNYLVTSIGGFQAQLIRITLLRMRLLAGQENQSRIAFFSVPQTMIRVSMPVIGPTALSRRGISACPGELIIHTGGQRYHEWTQGPSQWRAIHCLVSELVRFGRAINETPFSLPSGTLRWRPARAALRTLIDLHDSAIRATKLRPNVVVSTEAARGLEQQLFHALIECLPAVSSDRRGGAAQREAAIMGKLEDWIDAHPQQAYGSEKMCAALGVSSRTLRACTHKHLGIGPLRYLNLRRMILAHRTLRCANPDATSVSSVARQLNFAGLGRFAVAYREQFGEMPSVTLGHKGSLPA